MDLKDTIDRLTIDYDRNLFMLSKVDDIFGLRYAAGVYVLLI